MEARARGQGRQVGGHRNCHRQNHVAHIPAPAPGRRAVHGERGVAAVLPPLKREAVRTSESHPISLPPSSSSHPSVGPSVPLAALPPSVPPSFVFPHLNGPFNEGEKRARPRPRPSSRPPRAPPAQTILEFGAIRLSTEGGSGATEAEFGKKETSASEGGRRWNERSHARRMRRFRRSQSVI